jgi:segregation and condensation protein B
VPDPMGLRPGEDEDPLEDGDEAPEFAQDFLGDMERG